jgi:hypothetical protein
VSVLIGLCDFATFFLCCLPSIGLAERCGEGDKGDAIALDRRKDRIDGRRHRDSGKHLRRNPGQGANSSVFHLNASTVFTSTSNRARDLRGRIRFVQAQAAVKNGSPHCDAARMDAGKQGHPSTIHPSNA